MYPIDFIPPINEINMKWHRDGFALQHLLALYNRRNYCIHVQVYLFVRVHVHLSIGLTIMHV